MPRPDVPGLNRAVGATVPPDPRAGAVVASRDHALEVRILERMVLDVHGEPFLLRPHRRSLGNGPALEHALHFEAQVAVQVARPMLLHDEAGSGWRGYRRRARRGARCRDGAERLGGASRIALAAIGL